MPQGFTLETIRAARYNPGSPVSVNRLLPKGGRSLERSSGRGLKGVRLAGLGDSVAPSKRPSPGGPSGSKQTRVRGQSWPPAKPDLVLGPQLHPGDPGWPGPGSVPSPVHSRPPTKGKGKTLIGQKHLQTCHITAPSPPFQEMGKRPGMGGPGREAPSTSTFCLKSSLLARSWFSVFWACSM